MKSQNFHDAGYDAYITGTAFIAMLNKLSGRTDEPIQFKKFLQHSHNYWRGFQFSEDLKKSPDEINHKSKYISNTLVSNNYNEVTKENNIKYFSKYGDFEVRDY